MGTAGLRLALGTAQFGGDYGVANRRGRPSTDETAEILAGARAGGIDTLDTAIGYGDSEARLGALGVRDWRIVSKLPAIPDECPDVGTWVRREAEGSLRRLDVDQLHALLLHRPAQLLERRGERLYDALAALRDDGLVRKIGISIYQPDELDVILSRYAVDVVQAPFSVLDRRLIDSGWLRRLADRGVELHVRSIFLQGLLLMPAAERPRQFDRWQPVWDSWDAWVLEAGVSRLAACLRYALAFPEVERVIVGVDSATQLTEILAAADGSLRGPLPDLGASDPDLLNPARWSAVA